MRDRKGYVFCDQKVKYWIARTSVTDDTGGRPFVKRGAESKSEAEAKLKSLLRQLEDDGSKIADYNLMTFNFLAARYEECYLKSAEYINGQKVSGLQDVARPKQLMKHFRDWV